MMRRLIPAKILPLICVLVVAGTGPAQESSLGYVVHSGAAPQSGAVRPGMVLWVRADRATSIEWRYEPGQTVEPVTALVEADEWSFTIDMERRTAQFELDDEIRERWDEHGTLIVRYGGNEVEFRAKPRRLDPSSIRKGWTVSQRRESAVPGSRGYLTVSWRRIPGCEAGRAGTSTRGTRIAGPHELHHGAGVSGTDSDLPYV